MIIHLTEKLHFANLFWNCLSQDERKMALKSSELDSDLSNKPLTDDCFDGENIVEHTEKVTDGRINLQKLIAILYFYGIEHDLFERVAIG